VNPGADTHPNDENWKVAWVVPYEQRLNLDLSFAHGRAASSSAGE
jgi:hypothetical protein